MAFEIPKMNMFQQPIQQIGAVGAGRTQATGGLQRTAGGSQTPFEADMADFKRFLPKNNGTGDLQPKNDATMCFMA